MLVTHFLCSWVISLTWRLLSIYIHVHEETESIKWVSEREFPALYLHVSTVPSLFASINPCFSDATINYLLGLDISELCCCIGGDTLALCLSDLTWRLYSQATYLHIRKQNAVKSVHWELFFPIEKIQNEKQEVVQLRTRNCNGEKCPRSPRAAIKPIRKLRGGRAWQTHRRRRRAWKHYLLRMGFTQKTRVC